MKNKILGFILSLMSMSVMAQTSTSEFAPAVGSKAEAILQTMFATLMGKTGGDPLSSVLGVLNSVCLIVAGILIAYHLLSGIISTAYDGDFMGKKMNLATYPVRAVVATAVIVPIKGGYCAMQFIVMWLISLSIGFADTAWIAFMQKDNLKNTLPISLVRVDTKNLAGTILQNYVCVNSLHKATQAPEAELLGGKNSDFGITTIKNVNDAGKSQTVYNFGDKNEMNSFKMDTCGTLTVQDPVAGPAKKTNKGMFDTSTDVISAEAKSKMLVVMKAHQSQLNTMLSELSSFASEIVNGNGKVDVARLDKIANTYENAVKSTASSEVLDIDAFKELSQNASQDGFVGSIFFYNKIGVITDLIQRTMADVPVATGPVITNQFYADQFVQDYRKLTDALRVAQRSLNFGASYEPGGSMSAEESGGSVEKYIKKLITVSPDNFMLDGREHPIMALKRLGNTFFNFATGIYVGGLGAIAGAGIVGGFTGIFSAGAGQAIVSTCIAIVTSLINNIVPLLFGGAFFLSFVVPFVPVMLILSAIIGWTIMCIEAIVIAPLWAVMHISHGDEMVGSGTQGYRLLLNLLLKPILFVVGVIASFVLLQVFGSFINQIFSDVFMSVTEGMGIISLMFSALFASTIYAGVVLLVMMRLYKSMVEIPDSVMKWITNSDNVLGSNASQISTDNKMFAVGSTAVASVGGKMVSDMAGKGGTPGMAYKSGNGVSGWLKQKFSSTDDKQGVQTPSSGGTSPGATGEDTTPSYDAVRKMSETGQNAPTTASNTFVDPSVATNDVSPSMVSPSESTEAFGSNAVNNPSYGNVGKSVGETVAETVVEEQTGFSQTKSFSDSTYENTRYYMSSYNTNTALNDEPKKDENSNLS